ncbi:MAG: EndoU domain-containing protein [Polyangiaceae bacterium]|nr:EndoU domain-containing protein [Polyangiaceae bacterium]
MTILDTLSSRVRERLSEAEEEAHKVVSTVEKEASAVASKAKEAVASVAHWAEPSAPSQAVDDQIGSDIASFAKAQLSTLPSYTPSTLPIHHPGELLSKSKDLLNKSGELLREIPQAIPGFKEFDSLAQDHRAQVMGEAGLITGVVSGQLGLKGAMAQAGIDLLVDRLGTKEDKYAFGTGQMVSAVVTGAMGALEFGVGAAGEGGSGGTASVGAVPLMAVGVQTLEVAGSHAIGAHILMSNGTAPVAKPASPNTKPVIDMEHILHGGITKKGRAIGFHWRGKGCNNENARVTQILRNPNAQGAYRAEVEIKNPQTGQWVRKGSTSAFFPDHWTAADVESAISEAYANKTTFGTNGWEGTTSSGVKIRGYVNKAGKITTAFPILGRAESPLPP